MTVEEIEMLKKTFSQKTELWNQAFEEYNHNHAIRLHMLCRSCWFKVLKYHEQKIKVT